MKYLFAVLVAIATLLSCNPVKDVAAQSAEGVAEQPVVALGTSGDNDTTGAPLRQFYDVLTVATFAATMCGRNDGDWTVSDECYASVMRCAVNITGDTNAMLSGMSGCVAEARGE